MNNSFAFLGRENEIERLRSLHALRENVLLIGPAGIGKTALLRQIQRQCPVLISEETSSLRRICDSIERQLGWAHRKLNVIERKNRLLVYLKRRGEPVAFDHVAHVPPRVARFIAYLGEQVPIWIACRSDRPNDVGHVWVQLCRFARIEVGPLTADETRRLILQAANEGNIQTDACGHVRELYRMSCGNPRLLEELLIELAARQYKIDSSFGLGLLDLDRRIHEIVASASLSTKPGDRLEADPTER
jgi:SH3-like domain-containing protein